MHERGLSGWWVQNKQTVLEIIRDTNLDAELSVNKQVTYPHNTTVNLVYSSCKHHLVLMYAMIRVSVKHFSFS